MSIFKHIKSGLLYYQLYEGNWEADCTPVTIYQSVITGNIWVRPTVEFKEKFEYVGER